MEIYENKRERMRAVKRKEYEDKQGQKDEGVCRGSGDRDGDGGTEKADVTGEREKNSI